MRTKPIPETAAFGIDIDKKVFHVVAMKAAGSVIQRTKFSRDKLIAFFKVAPRSLIGMEACPGSQWLARRLNAMGHDARIIPARFVKPYVKSNKSDTDRRTDCRGCDDQTVDRPRVSHAQKSGT